MVSPIIVNGKVKGITISDTRVKWLYRQMAANQQNFQLGIVSVKKPQFLEKLGGNLYGLPNNYNHWVLH